MDFRQRTNGHFKCARLFTRFSTFGSENTVCPSASYVQVKVLGHFLVEFLRSVTRAIKSQFLFFPPSPQKERKECAEIPIKKL